MEAGAVCKLEAWILPEMIKKVENNMDQNLDSLRREIDEQDQILLKAFQDRMAVSLQIAEYKAKNNQPVYAPQRERELLDRLTQQASPQLRSYVRAFFLDIMQLSKSAQYRANEEDKYTQILKSALETSPKMLEPGQMVACQGVEGAYSQQAVETMFDFPNILYFSTFEGVFRAIDSGLCRYGVLPIENSTAGSVGAVYDLMLKYNFSIIKSCRVKVDHCLLVPKGVRLEDVRELFSQEQAINQCGEFLSTLGKDVKITAVRNTAEAAKMVASGERRDVAAISSHSCAELYGLDVVREDIQSSGNNHTRFICISKNLEILPGADRTSLMLTLPHRPGALFSVMSKINAYGINLEKLESRPLPNRDFEFMFYFDLRTPVYSEDLGGLLSHLEKTCESFRYLGSYLECV